MRNIRTYSEMIREGSTYPDPRELFRAVRSNDLEECARLLGMGADVNASEPASGATALHIAVANDYLDIARLLLERGADVNTNDTEFEETPLGYAVMENSFECVMELMKWKCDDNNIMGAVRMAKWDHERDAMKAFLLSGVGPLRYIPSDSPFYDSPGMTVFEDYKELFDFFDGDLTWWNNPPEEIRDLVERSKKTRGLFNR